MNLSKSTLKLQSYLAVGILLLNISNLAAASNYSDSESRFNILKTQFVTNQETIIKSTSLLPITLISTNQDSEEEKPKEVKSKKKWYITAGTLIVSSVSAYLLLIDKGNGKAKIPGPPSRPANP